MSGITSSPKTDAHAHGGELVPLRDYRRSVLSRLGPLAPIQLGLLEARGCVLVEDVHAEQDVPAFANSAMDGYAVRRDDAVAGKQLDVVGEVAAGASELPEVGSGQAVRIMTGAPMPPGAEFVVPVEIAEEGNERVHITGDPGERPHVRDPGESVRAGDKVLEAGRRLDAADVGMLAALGCNQVVVHPRPRVVVLATGDELVDPGGPLAPGQIYDSNSFMLTALVREAEATAYRHPIIVDDRQALTESFQGALVHGDVLLTTGGVSAGRYDLVKAVLAELGDVKFTKVGMQPGMPQAFGFLSDVPCFALPGNPVSAYVSFEVLVRPALRRMQGRSDLNRPRIKAVLQDRATSPANKVTFLRVRLEHSDEGWRAWLTGEQGSGILRSVVDADGLAEVPVERTTVEPGEQLVVHLLGDPA